MKYRINIEQDEDGMFTATVPALPGCVSEGTSRESAIENIRDAAHDYLESLRQHDEPIPPPIELKNGITQTQRSFPLQGLPHRYTDPFEPAISPEDWGVK
jgi:antitoxin HicB